VTGAGAPVVAVVFGYGSATAMDIGRAAGDWCELVFICDHSSAYVQRSLPVLEDLGLVVGLTDPDHVAEALRPLGVTGIVAFADPELVLAARIAQRLELPFHGADTTAALVDKHLQRVRLAGAGVDAVRFAVVHPDGAAAAAARVGLPAVLKPRRGSGSRNTVLVHTQAELAHAVGAAFERGESELVLEEYLAGDERVAGPEWGDYVSVESVAYGDHVVHIGITGKPPLARPFRETGAVFPCTLSDEVAAAALALTSRALGALGVRHGICHTELKLTPAGPRLIEVNGRLGGYVDDVVSRASGLSPLRLALAAAAGIAPEAGPARAERVAYQLFVLPPLDARSVTAIRGLEAAAALPGVLRVEARRGAGEAVDWRDGTDSAVVVVHGEAPDHATVVRVRRSLAETLVVDYGA
jgi:biotin carboxylase